MPIFKKVNKDFFKVWTHEMAYILGFFAADGYMTINKRGAHFWNFQITDLELLESIKEAIKSEHKISIRPRRKINEQTQYRLQIGSKEMCGDLRNLGFTEGKTKVLKLPEIPNQFLGDFVRGYFDGDGHVSVRNIYKYNGHPVLSILTGFTSCSKLFLMALKKQLASIGLNGGCLVCRGTYFRLQYSVQDSKKLYRLMYENLGNSRLFLHRKKVIFDMYLHEKDSAAVV